jgi:transcriptional regulator with XRE-family HTH domain
VLPTDIKSYTELVAALVARRNALGVTQEVVNEVGGLAAGYVSKVECGTKRLGKVTLALLLGALGLKLTLSEDPEALERVRGMFEQRTPKTKMSGPCTIDREKGWLTEIEFAPEALVEECQRLRQELDALRAGAACALPKPTPPQPRRKAGRKKARRAVQRPLNRSKSRPFANRPGSRLAARP